jgi:hypothetical protein
MRITLSQLRRIIKEEVSRLTEGRNFDVEKQILADLAAMKFGSYQQLGDDFAFRNKPANAKKFADHVRSLGYTGVKMSDVDMVRIDWNSYTGV